MGVTSRITHPAISISCQNDGGLDLGSTLGVVFRMIPFRSQNSCKRLALTYAKARVDVWVRFEDRAPTLRHALVGLLCRSVLPSGTLSPPVVRAMSVLSLRGKYLVAESWRRACSVPPPSASRQ
eukprot:g82221.t1